MHAIDRHSRTRWASLATVRCRAERRPARQTVFIFFVLLFTALLAAAGAPSPSVVASAPCPFRPEGPELRVNTTTVASLTKPRAAMDAAGDFVVVWSSPSRTYLQRFDASGVPQGAELELGTTPSHYREPAVAMDADGDFVLAWRDTGGGGLYSKIYARRFSASGVMLGDEFRVSTTSDVTEMYPSVGIDAAGNFTIVWLGSSSSLGQRIYTRSFSAAGAAQGPESTLTSPPFNFPTGTISAARGRFGASPFAWVGMTPGTQYQQIFVRGGGVPLSRVSTSAGGNESAPSLAKDAAGNFVVTWVKPAAGGQPSTVYARAFQANGVARGPEFEISADAFNPSVRMDDAGNFVVAWNKATSGQVPGVYARRYDVAGVAQGPEFLVGNGWGSGRSAGEVEMDSDGDFVVLSGGVGNSRDVYAQRYKVDCQASLGAVVQFGSADFHVTEGCTAATITVSVDRPPDAAQTDVTVDYTLTGGTASPRNDYTFAAGRLSFAPGEAAREITVLLSEDGYAEGQETVTLALLNPAGATLGTTSTTTLRVDDNDTADAATNPIDDPATFVCQHYHDFLGRQPDDAGLAFWTSDITRCGADAACVAEKRHNVSAAFFLSLEFQQTGYFVGRLYEACLGRRPQYEEFMRDVQQLGLGVEVGVGDWERRLETNKQAFAAEFVGRSEFLRRYPVGMSAELYADKMFEYAGVPWRTDAEWRAAVEAYGAGDAAGRAAAMRKAMESASVYRHYYNRGFVLAEYFGYLRRDPNDPPDTDWGGYDFWLGKMDDFSLPGEDVTREGDAFARVRRGEMVRAFIESLEYRQRFGKPKASATALPSREP